MARSNALRSALSRAPLLRLCLPFITGLIIGEHLEIPALPVGLFALVAGAVWYLGSGRALGYARRWVGGAGLFTLCILCGVFWQRLHTPNLLNAELSRERSTASAWRMTVTELISESPRTLRLWTAVDAALDSTGARPAHGRLLLTVMKDSTAPDPAIGDELLVMARVDTLDDVADPGGFDQVGWAASYGVLHQCFAPEGRWRVLRRVHGFSSWFAGARERISAWLERSDLDARERGLVKAILLGVRDELDADQKMAFARSGTMHVLAVSGSHVALIYGVLLLGFRKLGEQRRLRIIRSIVILLVLWGYAGLTGATPSVMRATVTFTFFCIADMFGRQSDPVNSLGGAALLLLVWDPVMLGQLSFQLSFLAVLGIAMFYRPLMHLWTPPNLVSHYLWSLFAVSISAQAMTTPLALLSFHAFPTWFLPANMVIVGLVAVGVWGGGLFLVLRLIPIVSEAATGFMVSLLKVITWTADTFAHLPGAYPAVRIGPWQCMGLYALVLLLAGWLLERWNWARNGTLAMATILLLSWGWSARERNHRARFTIYHERDKLNCAVESGRTLTVLSDSLDQWTARKVDRHQREIGATDVDVRSALPSRITLRGHTTLFTGPADVDTTLNGRPGLVVLTEDARYDMDGLFSALQPPEGFVLAPTISARHRAYLRRWCAEHHVAVHDIREQGAYVRDR